ncbi:MAG: protein-L-isoaspartate O-methyltransferase family protein, partial [Bryobacteraceae bacterium]
MTLDEYRRFYAEEICIVANLRPSELVDAFAAVSRENYLGPPPWQICSGDQAALASLGLGGELYTSTDNPRDLCHNVLVAIDPARYLNNGHPSTLARWIAALDLKSGARVYHAGCGVGYYTAILAEIVGPHGSVIAIDVDATLAARARQNLSGYSYVSVHAGDGADFDPGMCDAMLINAGVTHPHRPWLDHLKHAGCIVLPLTAKSGENHGHGIMAKITREESGFSASVVSYVAIFSFSSVREPEMETLLGKSLVNRDLFKLKSVRLDEHEPAGT